MLTPALRPATQVKPGLKPARARPSDALLQALTTKDGAEKLAREVESSPLFQRLVAQGIIRKVGWYKALLRVFLTTNAEVHEPPSAPYTADITDIIEIADYFVRRYKVSQKDFETYILSGEYSAREIVERFGCSRAEADSLLNAITQLEIVDTFTELTTPASGLALAPLERQAVVAEVVPDELGHLHVVWLNPRLNSRYRINHERLQVWLQTQGELPEVRSILQKVQALNEFTGALSAVVHTVCSLQKQFLLSGDQHDLRPLYQAEVARHTGYHRSVISRLVQGQWLQAPCGCCPLRSLMPTRKEVIKHLAQTYPEWSDSQIASYLHQRFGLTISRRSVNYHRRS